MATIPTELANVTVQTKANLYHDAGVISHTVLMPDGLKKTLGLIRPGRYHFGTAAAERMEIVAGACEVKRDGETAVTGYRAGEVFEIPGQSGFDIEVRTGICEYICTFLA